MTEIAEPQRWQSLKNSLTWRALVVALLSIIMLIPLLAVKNLLQERQTHKKNVLNEVAGDWGGSQTLVGPVMVLPYVEHITSVDTITDDEGENKVITKDIYNEYTAIILPESLEIRADLAAEQRQRGIYNTLLYNANIKISGKFNHKFLLEAEEGERRIQWEQAYLMMGVSDTKAIDANTRMLWDTEAVTLRPGTRLPDLLPHGFHVALDSVTSNAVEHDFRVDLKLRGSDSLFFAPLGKTTTVRMTSGWQHPSFRGDILPENHETGESGFNASWEISNLARNYPQFWLLEQSHQYDPNAFSAGVSLYEPVSPYTQVERALKYGVLFTALTFLTFFAFEISSQRSLHTLQYGTIGFALVLFYLILLSLAEHIPFRQAYIAAAASVVLMISAYTWSVLHSFWKALLIMITLGSLYYLLYLILRLEDYALLAGSGLLILATLMMMLVTRNIR